MRFLYERRTVKRNVKRSAFAVSVDVRRKRAGTANEWSDKRKTKNVPKSPPGIEKNENP